MSQIICSMRIKYLLMAFFECSFLAIGFLCTSPLINVLQSKMNTMIVIAFTIVGLYFLITALGLFFRKYFGWRLLYLYLFIISFGDRGGIWSWILRYLEGTILDEFLENTISRSTIHK